MITLVSDYGQYDLFYTQCVAVSQCVTVPDSATVSSCKRTQSQRHPHLVLTAWLLCGCAYTVRHAQAHDARCVSV